jgi:hypothetical protein
MVEELQRAALLDAELAGAEIVDNLDAPASDGNSEMDQLKRQLEEVQSKLRGELESVRAAEAVAKANAEAAERRRADTERWAQEQNRARIEAEQKLGQAASYFQQQQVLQPPQPPPKLNSSEYDALLADPQRFEAYTDAKSKYAHDLMEYKLAVAAQQLEQRMQAMAGQFDQRLQQVGSYFQNSLGPVQNLGEMQAQAQAEAALVANGVSVEDYRARLPEIMEEVRRAQPGLGSNPQAIFMAYYGGLWGKQPKREKPEPPISLRGESSVPGDRSNNKQLSREALAALAKIQEDLGPGIAKKVVKSYQAGVDHV